MAILGTLAWDPAVGLGLRRNDGLVTSVIWPFGYTARRDSEGVILFDRSGVALAREGNRIQMTGWTDFARHVAHACDPPLLSVVEGT